MRRQPIIRVMAFLTLVLAATSTGGAAADEPQSLRFEDVTEAAGINTRETIGDLEMSNLVEAAGVGCGFLDYDGDGLLDIYLVSGCWTDGLSDPKLARRLREELAKATDRLLRNRGDGTFEDVTDRAGLARPAFGMGVVVADCDADGDPDIYVTNYGPNSLYRNNGDGTFTDVAEKAGVADAGFSLGAVFLDYDRDGILDLYVGNYVTYDPDYDYYYAPDGFPGPLAYKGQQDRLFHGKGDGTFEDVTARCGVKIKPLGRAMGVGAFDFDGDGWMDIFVSNDAMENFLLHNKRNGKFENVALLSGVAYGESGEATAAMAAEVADFDNDGKLDLFVPDMRFSCLYHNAGDSFFDETSARSGIAAASGQYVSWGSVFADFDLDGKLDLYVSNGDLHHLEPQEDLVFLGDGKGRFRDVSEGSGDWARRKFVSRGVAGGDFDNDGDVDLLVVNLNDRPVLLRNDTTRRGRHWIGFKLVGTGGNRDAIGSIVRVHVGSNVLTRLRTSGGSYVSQHDHRLHFGIGDADKIDKLEIVWPDGTVKELQGLAVDRYHLVRKAEARK